MRTLALRLTPVEGESLRGYLGRYAAGFGFAPGEVVEAFGLAGEHRFDGLRLTPAQAGRAAAASGISPETIRAMTPERYAGSAFSSSGAGGGLLPRPVLAQEVSVFSSRACPACLREDGAWLLRWQLGWSLLCTRHRLLLISTCPACGGRLGPSRRARWGSDGHGELRDHRACRSAVDGRLCRFPVAEAQAIDLAADPDLVAAQRRIDRMLAGGPRPQIAGEEVPPLAYLRDLHALALLLRKHPEFAAGRPAALRREAARQADTRGRLMLSPAALAAVLPEAMRLADLPDEAALVDGLREVLDRRHRADGATLPKLRELRAPSGRLAGALRHARQTAGFAHVSTQMGFDPLAHRRPEDLDPRLEPRHVPQLFWAEDYGRRLAAFFDFDEFDDVSDRFGRRFCSALLARLLEPLEWQAAARRLDLPARFHNKGYQTCQGRLRQSGRFEAVVYQVKAAANERAATGPLVDHRARRALLADWEGIDPECWLYLQPVRRPERWRVDPPKRRAHASIWLWCELISGHEQAAPIAFPARGLHEHTLFGRRFLPDLRERLLIFGELLLETPADARSTLPTRLAAALHERGYLAAGYRLDTVDASITRRVLAQVAAHTGVDLATLTTAVGGQAPAAVTHARLLAAAVLRRTTLASWGAIASVLPGGHSRLASNDRAYRATLDRDPTSAGELEALIGRVRDLGTPAPVTPEVPYRRRMGGVAEAIKERAAELLPTEGDLGLRAGTLACREHTDLTWPQIAVLHHTRAHPTLFQATVAARRREDPDFDGGCRELLDFGRQRRRAAGFANARLTRGLTNNPKAAGNDT